MSAASSPSSTSWNSSSSTLPRSTRLQRCFCPRGSHASIGLLPIRFVEDGYVLVAVADPTNVVVADEVRLAVGMPVRLCVSTPELIDAGHSATHARRCRLDRRRRDRCSGDRRHGERPRPPPRHPAVVFINRVIAKALDLGASDIHFTPRQRRLYVRIRVDGVLRELSSIPGTQAGAVAARLKIMGGLDIAERRTTQDGRAAVRRGDQSHDVRIAVLPTTYGEKVTLRILSQGEAPSFSR